MTEFTKDWIAVPRHEWDRYENAAKADSIAKTGDALRRQSIKEWLTSRDPAPSYRLLDASIGTAGAFTIGETVLPLHQALSPYSRIAKHGAQFILAGGNGGEVAGNDNAIVIPRGDVSFPQLSRADGFEWLSEVDESPELSFSLSRVNCSPHRIGGTFEITSQLLAQSPSFEAAVYTATFRELNRLIDNAAVAGSGTLGEPLGLLHIAGTQSVTFGAAATWAKVCEIKRKWRDAYNGNGAWFISPATEEKWSQKSRVTDADGFLLEDGRINGFPVEVSFGLADSGRVVLGDFRECSVVVYSVELLRDAITYAKSGKVIFHINALVDIAFNNHETFVVSTDSGAQ